jgi:RND family efflux transporter MFP subunit
MKWFTSLTKKLKHLWKTKRWWVIAAVIVFIILGWRAMAGGGNEQATTFVSPQRTNLVKTLEVSGTVDAKEKAALRFPSGGKVVYLGAKEGEIVKKWQTIAQIDARTLANQQQQNLNAYSQQRLTWDQSEDDFDDGPDNNATRREQAREQLLLDNAVLGVEAAQIAVTNTVMSSPLTGILVESPTSVTGVQLSPTDTFLVVNPATLIFRALVDEADIAMVQLNQSASIELDAYAGEFVNSVVTYVAYQSNQTASGTVFAVEFPISATEGLAKYRLGMNGDVSITLEEKQNVLAIPLIATRERDGKVFVDVQTGESTTEEREITTGLETDEQVEVLSGLSESDRIAVPE